MPGSFGATLRWDSLLCATDLLEQNEHVNNIVNAAFLSTAAAKKLGLCIHQNNPNPTNTI